MQGEVACKTVHLPPPNLIKGHQYHAFCSRNNPGSRELLEELAAAKSIEVRTTDRLDELDKCEHMLCYLTADTWTSGATSEAFADEIRRAMDTEMNVLLAHEMVGFGGQTERHGCEFSDFFACADGTTPSDLIFRGIYGTIAVAMKGGEWRKPSHVLLAEALAAFEAEPEAQRKRREKALAKQALKEHHHAKGGPAADAEGGERQGDRGVGGHGTIASETTLPTLPDLTPLDRHQPDLDGASSEGSASTLMSAGAHAIAGTLQSRTRACPAPSAPLMPFRTWCYRDARIEYRQSASRAARLPSLLERASRPSQLPAARLGRRADHALRP